MVDMSRWSIGKKGETKRYHKALDVLGEMRARNQMASASRSEHDAPAPHPANPPMQASSPRTLQIPAFFPGTTREDEDLSLEHSRLVFVDEALLSDQPDHTQDTQTSFFARRRILDATAPRHRYLLMLGAAAIILGGTAIGVLVSNSLPTHTKRGVAHTRTPSSRTAPPPRSATVAPRPKPGVIPRIYSLTPATGSAGQTLTVSGSGFLSANGSIVATFGSQTTQTSCPTSDQCFVTVPPGSNTAVVRITTESGVSNPLTFHYG
jgi:hypothetical protein